MIWDQVLRAASGTGADFSNEGNIHVAKLLMNEEGSARLADYLASHPNMPDALRARVIGIFLKRFAREDEVETEILALRDRLHALLGREDLAPCVASNARFAAAAIEQIVNDLDLELDFGRRDALGL